MQSLNELKVFSSFKQLGLSRKEACLVDEALDFMIDWYIHDDEVLLQVTELKDKISKFVYLEPLNKEVMNHEE